MKRLSSSDLLSSNPGNWVAFLGNPYFGKSLGGFMAWPGRKSDKHATRVQRPVARTDELIVEEVEEQVLIYDQRNDQAHCLNPAAAQVWRACDGATSREQLARQLELDPATVEQALDELETCGLLDGAVKPGMTRREATARFAKVGAAAATAPLIYSIVSPAPAAAQSITAACQAVNSITAGHDCGGQCPPVVPPKVVGCHCATIGSGGCCCCHNFTGAPLTTICAGDPEHCCTSPQGCAAAGGSPCS